MPERKTFQAICRKQGDQKEQKNRIRHLFSIPDVSFNSKNSCLSVVIVDDEKMSLENPHNKAEGPSLSVNLAVSF